MPTKVVLITGAAIRIDGEPSGNVPLRKTLTPGRHLRQVGKRGFATFSKWVDLVGGQVMTIPVALQPQEAKTGSLLITADVTGMPLCTSSRTLDSARSVSSHSSSPFSSESPRWPH